MNDPNLIYHANPATVYFAFNRLYRPVWNGAFAHNPFLPGCAFCGDTHHAIFFTSLMGRLKKNRLGTHMFWKVPLCLVCRRQMCAAGSLFCWLRVLPFDDVRWLRIRGYLEWAHFYAAYTPHPTCLTDVYFYNTPFVWQTLRLL